MNIPSIATVFNWRNEKNKSGLYSIHLRITIDRDSRYYKIPLPQKVLQAQWSGREDSWVKNLPFSFEINKKIIEKKDAVNEIIKRNYNTNKSLFFETIFKHLERKENRKPFYQYMLEFIANPPEKLELNTIKKYNTCLSHLQSFRKELYFSDIDNTVIRDFHKHIQVKQDLVRSSCKKYIDAFK